MTNAIGVNRAAAFGTPARDRARLGATARLGAAVRPGAAQPVDAAAPLATGARLLAPYGKTHRPDR